MHTAQYWIEKLQLQKHPEGGYFKEVYRADEAIPKHSLHERYTGERNHSTSIYFLITSNESSAFHRIKSDETWHFYTASFITIHTIDEKGKYSAVKLGSNPEKGEVFQFTIPHDTWFAASVNEPDSYTLVGCTVAPGFHYDDFELGKREELIKLFPQHEGVIRKFTISN
jgi:predicted cupin superfamily sugar epimerase